MNKPIVVFLITYFSFCVTATYFIYEQGAFKDLQTGGAIILVVAYLIVGFFIHRYVKNYFKNENSK